MSVNLKFNSDFTSFLANDEVHEPLLVIHDSGTIKCSKLLLFQHSQVLEESLKGERELFVTENEHVSECLTILYGGAVKLSVDNFQDILKFMVKFDLQDARKQILDWMTAYSWNFESAQVLMNVSITCAKAWDNPEESIKSELYRPAKDFLCRQLPNLVASERRNQESGAVISGKAPEVDISLKSVMDSICSGINDKDELLTILLDESLLPDYLPCITDLVEDTHFNVFIESLKNPDLLIKLSISPRKDFEKLFDKIEELEITLSEYKQLNRYKMTIHEKMVLVQSLKLMKESDSLYFCWKQLDSDGISLLPVLFKEKSDQFCVIECIVSWLSHNHTVDNRMLNKFFFEVVNNLQKNLCGYYFTQYYGLICSEIQSKGIVNGFNPPSQSILTNSAFPNMIAEIPNLALKDISRGNSNEIILNFTGTRSEFSVTLHSTRIPNIDCKTLPTTDHFFLYSYSTISSRIPFYTEPEVAFQTISQNATEVGHLRNTVHFFILSMK